MRMIISLLIVVATVGAVYYYRADLGIESNLTRGMSQVRQFFEKSGNPAGTTTIYKHRNAQGEWVFTNEPPGNGEPANVLQYRNDTNVVPMPGNALPAEEGGQVEKGEKKN